jgi:hypothetical protein
MAHAYAGAASRCVFWICNATCSGGLSPLPDVPPSVCYPSGRHRQRRRPKPGGQRSLDRKIGRERASRLGDCQHHGGREPAVRDMVNQSEVPIKVVISDKPKMLLGLNQNGMWSGTGSSPVSRRGWCTTGRQARPKSRVIQKMNEVTPLSSPRGKWTEKNADEMYR